MSDEGVLLFVDDEEIITSTLRRIFVPLGYTVHLANGGQEGLEVLEKEDIDVVISDMRMPEMDGARFLKQVADNFPSCHRILLTGYADMASTISAVNDGKIHHHITKPWDDDEIKKIIALSVKEKRENAQNSELTTKLQSENETLERKVDESSQELEVAYAKLKEQYESIVHTFSHLIEVSTGQHQGHLKRVAENAKRLAEALELSDEKTQEITVAAQLSDIGRLGLPEELRYKPEYQLTKDDWIRYERHPSIAATLLNELTFMGDVPIIIHQHKEALDGSGYPKNLRSAEIHESAKILRIAKDYDSLQVGMLINQELPPNEALKMLGFSAGKVYEQKYIDTFSEIFQSCQTAKAIDEEIIEGDVIRIPIHGLTPGMTLAKAITTDANLTLVPKGTKLTKKLIEKLFHLDIREVRIENR